LNARHNAGNNEQTHMAFLDGVYGPTIVLWNELTEDAPATPREWIEATR
jgi:hypothetical protein